MGLHELDVTDVNRPRNVGDVEFTAPGPSATNHSGPTPAVASAVEGLATDNALSLEARRELSDIGYAVRFADR
ncbi:MAG: hypothetical protein JO272_04420 [Pseudonocardiales bacterium]|nr:hypothetical protein [Pseudonocardiales bacterium]